MMFGTGMPILFPIAFVTFTILFIVEKGMLYYSYREPPMYDEFLNSAAFNVMRFAPLLMLGFGYWMLSSKQLISNQMLIPKVRKNLSYSSGHYVVDALLPWTAVETNTWASLLLLAGFWICLINIVFFDHGRKIEIDNVEVLDTYYRCLDDDDRNWTIKEEKNLRDNYKLKCMYDFAFKELCSTRNGKCCISGVHSYDILRNSQYV